MIQRYIPEDLYVIQIFWHFLEENLQKYTYYILLSMSCFYELNVFI